MGSEVVNKVNQLVRDALDAVDGADAIEVAHKLRLLGVKGVPMRADRCAITQAVNFDLPEGWHASTCGGGTRAFGENERGCVSIMGDEHYLSRAQQNFVQLFDNGAFPDLVVEGYTNPYNF